MSSIPLHFLAPHWLLVLVIGAMVLASCAAPPTPAPDRYATVAAGIEATNTVLRQTATPTAIYLRPIGTPVPTAPTAPGTGDGHADGPGPEMPLTATDAARLQRQVATAETALRGGLLESVADFGHGARATTRVRFDRGDATHPPVIVLTTTYQATTGGRTDEHLVVGDRIWRREADGRWQIAGQREPGVDLLHDLLPRAAALTDLAATSTASTYQLTGYDPLHDADVALTIDPATGRPRLLRRVARATSLVVTISYSGWNTPIAITLPNEVAADLAPTAPGPSR